MPASVCCLILRLEGNKHGQRQHVGAVAALLASAVRRPPRRNGPLDVGQEALIRRLVKRAGRDCEVQGCVIESAKKEEIWIARPAAHVPASHAELCGERPLEQQQPEGLAPHILDEEEDADRRREHMRVAVDGPAASANPLILRGHDLSLDRPPQNHLACQLPEREHREATDAARRVAWDKVVMLGSVPLAIQAERVAHVVRGSHQHLVRHREPPCADLCRRQLCTLRCRQLPGRCTPRHDKGDEECRIER
mmetsp:Transcript_82158/g.163684  ORF Transcript_82158/g.163684 Transcript_82158/m.163684 type:complete len:251 (-) Transcript_82158:201-953(-)